MSEIAKSASHILGWISLSLLLLAGCKVGPNYQSPKIEVTEKWLVATRPSTTRPATTRASVAIAQPADFVGWWRRFNDPMLDSLIDRAVQDNLDLKAAEVRIRQAQAQRGVVAGGFWPTADLPGSYQRTGGNGNGAAATGHDLWRAGLDAAWEIDIFGGTRRNIEAAEADVRAAIEDRRDVMVSLVSEVALDYVDLRTLQQQIVIARNNLESQRSNLSVTRRRQQTGFVSGLDVANAQAQVATTESLIPLLESDEHTTLFNLATLLGLEPSQLVQELSKAAPIPVAPDEVPIGLPSDLLERRPDIRRLNEQLHAATARIGVATADLFPRFSLTGSLAVAGTHASSLTNWGNRAWAIGPDVSWPLFSAGQIRANIAVQNAAAEELLLAYRATVLGALRDVQSALIAYAKEQEHRAALADAVTANRRAVDLSTQLYTQGQTDFLNVLSAQRSLLLSEDAVAQSDRTIATNLIALYKALGGGWESGE